MIEDCISKKVKINNGERPKYYVENNHPAIIDAVTFARVQEELARRTSKPKVKQQGTKTEQGRYSSKYALTELLVCGECKTPYRRCTWTVKGTKKIVWRCISRLDFGKKYCKHSPTIEESVLHEAIMNAIMRTAQQNTDVLRTLKTHIGMGLDISDTEDTSLDIQIQIAEIDAEFKTMLDAISTDNAESFNEQRAKELMDEKSRLQGQLTQIADRKQKRENAKTRLDEIYAILCDVKDFMGKKMTNIGISLVKETDNGDEHFTVLTKSFGEFIGAKNCAYIDTNNCPLADIILEVGIARDIDFSITSGFFTYPLWEFDEDFLRKIGGEEYEKYSQAYDTYMRGDCYETVDTDD